MASVSQPVPSLPDEIAGYRTVRKLGDAAYLCLAPGERYVVLKLLDPECIIKGQLHPSIKERLARVRELAHGGVANLYSVDRDDGAVWLVWEYVDAPTLHDFFAGKPSLREAWVVARELVLGIEALHARGIVHGAIHERNVIVERSRELRLTDVSPLLYTEPADDETALLDLLERVGQAPFERLGELAREARGQSQPLRWLRGKLAELIDERANPALENAEPVLMEPASGRAAMIAAIVLILLGIAIALCVVYWVRVGSAPKVG